MSANHTRIEQGEKTRAAMLRYLTGRDRDHWPSSVREIGLAVGLSSPAAVHRQLRILKSQGLIEQHGRQGFRAVRKEVAA